MPTRFHVLGTDTEVGKSYLTSLLLEISASRDIPSLPIKPVHSGWPKHERWGEDLRQHRQWIPDQLQPNHLCRYSLAAPISPYSAAVEANEKITLVELQAFAETWSDLEKSHRLLIEGVGGICCPLAENLTYLDWLELRKEKCILVAKVRLGCLNHTLMSLRLLEEVGMQTMAVVLNQTGADSSDQLACTKVRWELEHLTTVPILGPLPTQNRPLAIKLLSEELPKECW